MSASLEVIIGLEVHAQMNTKTKMFCGCDNDAFGKAPNTTVCPVCMGHPGTLPVPNVSAIEKALRASLALQSSVQAQCHFDRKHYFYPDLPSGFQISQYDFPLAKGGRVTYELQDDSGAVTATKTCGITRLHIENDAGKLTHRGKTTLCDFNRAGTPLMEIVTQPDLRSAEEAVAFAMELRRMLIAVDASEADMFKGMMRFDASISLRVQGSSVLNPRSEIKNLNSFKSLEKALEYEERRLRAQWEETGGPLPRDITVGWMDDEEKTRVLREKETADDYRYFPEPDIPPLRFLEADIRARQAALPPMPLVLRQQYRELGLTDKQAVQIIDHPPLRTVFDAVYQYTKDGRRAGSIVLTQLIGFLNAAEKTVEQGPDAAALLALLKIVDDGQISAHAAKDVLEEMVQSGASPATIIAARGLQQIGDEGAIAVLIQRAIAENPQAIAAYLGGKEQALGAIVGWIMKESRGQADPKKVSTMLRTALQSMT